MFEDGKQKAVTGLPDLLETAGPKRTFDLTIVVPAYNEEARLPVMMKETIPYLESKAREGKLFKSVEMIIVNDGSKDKTSDLIQKYSEQHSSVLNIVVRGVSLL